MTVIDFKQSIADPVAVDLGNREVQGRVVSKTIKLASFTTNENAVWAGRQALLKESYPFAYISFSANRNLFRFEVGDCFKFSYTQYGISNMICRVLQIEEAELESEIITIHAMEDIFSVNNTLTEYTDPKDHTIDPQDYSVEPLEYQNIIESLYLAGGDIIPLAARSAGNQLGYELFMSSDGGASYNSLGVFGGFGCHGILVQEYPADTYQIDDTLGITVDFSNDDINQFETITRQDLLGISNLIIIDNEIMTVQNIDPIDGGNGLRYHLTGIYRGRFDTKREDHAVGDSLYLTNGNNIQIITDADILFGTDRKFKFVPYNAKQTADIADCPAIDLTLTGRARKPYIPINFKANSNPVNPTYETDITLTWSPRIRNGGAGYFAPNVTDSAPTWEGFFRIEVWVSGSLVRTQGEIDAIEWVYTETMNLADNGTLAEQITFKLTNFIEFTGQPDAESATIELTVNKA